MAIRYLLDEHIAPAYRTELLRAKPDLVVWLIGDPGVPSKGTLDPEILEWCEENSFLLVTNNRKSMPGHLVDHLANARHVPGILVINPDRGMGTMIDQLVLIASALHEEEYQDLIIYLPIS